MIGATVRALEQTRVPTSPGRITRPHRVAIVAKCGWVNGLAAIRSLGRRNVDVLALDYQPSALGFESKYATPIVCPDPLASESAFVEFMLALGDDLDCSAPILPTNDELLNAIGKHQQTLGARFHYPFPSWDLLGPIQTKRFQVERAESIGVPHPRTSFEPTDELGFPVLVKPSDPAPFQRAFNVHSFRCETRAELEVAYARALPYDPLVQEFIPGGDDELYTLGAYISREGEILGVFSGRKLRQTPPGAGTCRVGESMWVDDMVEQGLRYLRGLRYHGLAQVEFKRDARDGRYKLMEINPRLWQWHGLAAACGVDFVELAYRDLLGEAVEPKRVDRAHVRWAITLVPGESPALVRPPFVDGVFAHDDPRPGLVHVRRVLAAGKVARLVRRARRRMRLALAALGVRKKAFDPGR